jgi:hypothetical protein
MENCQPIKGLKDKEVDLKKRYSGIYSHKQSTRGKVGICHHVWPI